MQSKYLINQLFMNDSNRIWLQIKKTSIGSNKNAD